MRLISSHHGLGWKETDEPASSSVIALVWVAVFSCREQFNEQLPVGLGGLGLWGIGEDVLVVEMGLPDVGIARDDRLACLSVCRGNAVLRHGGQAKRVERVVYVTWPSPLRPMGVSPHSSPARHSGSIERWMQSCRGPDSA